MKTDRNYVIDSMEPRPDYYIKRADASVEPAQDVTSVTMFWKNADGWVADLDKASRFTEEEKQTLNLPKEGVWVKVFDVLATMKYKAIVSVNADAYFSAVTRSTETAEDCNSKGVTDQHDAVDYDEKNNVWTG